MENEQSDMIKEVIQSNEMLRTQIWILTAVLGAMFVVIVGIGRSTWLDVKSMIENHASRLYIVEKAQAVQDLKIETLEDGRG